MAITYIPPQKNAIDRLNEAIAPYLQMAMEAKLREQMGQKEFERKKELDKLSPEEKEYYQARTGLTKARAQEIGGGKPTISFEDIKSLKEQYGGTPTLKVGPEGVTGATFKPPKETTISDVEKASKRVPKWEYLIPGVQTEAYRTYQNILNKYRQGQGVGQEQPKRKTKKKKEDKFDVGAVYENAEGEKKRYLGNGEWEDI